MLVDNFVLKSEKKEKPEENLLKRVCFSLFGGCTFNKSV